MKPFLAVLALFISSSVMALDEKTVFEGPNKISAMIIISDDNNVAKTAAKAIYNADAKDQNLLDLLAEVLYSNINNASYDIDLMAWQAKALGSSGQQRYKPVLEALINNVNGDKKLIRYGESSLEMLNEAPQEAYQPKPNVLSFFRKNLTLSSETNPALAKSYFEIPLSSSIEDVIAKIGMPNKITVEESNVINAGVPGGFKVKVKTNALVLTYFGCGKIFLNQEDGGAQKVTLISNAYYLTKDIKDQPTIDMVETLLSSDWIGMTQKISRERNRVHSELVYDIAMERLLETVSSRAGYEEKMLAYLARFIGNSKNPKYISALNKAKEQATSGAIKRHVEAALETINESGKQLQGASYNQGDVNIGRFSAAKHVF